MQWIIVLLMFCQSSFGQTQQVENRTSLDVLNTSVSERSTILHLRNTSNLALLGITVTRGPSSDEDLAFQPTQKVAPSQVFDFTTATSDRPIVLSAALFEDGSGSGNQRLIDTMAARLSGREAASLIVLAALTKESSKDALLEIVSLSEPTSFSSEKWTDHAYRAGFQGIKERALREIKKLREGQALVVESAGNDDIKVYFQDVLKVRRVQ